VLWVGMKQARETKVGEIEGVGGIESRVITFLWRYRGGALISEVFKFI
jgi:hypothetical protein